MRITTCIMLIACLHLSAVTRSQTVTFSVKNKTLFEVLQIIEQQTGYVALSKESILSKAKPITLNIKNRTIEQSLQLLFKDLPFQYHIVGKTILIEESGTTVPHAAQAVSAYPTVQQIVVRGKVSNEQGEALSGVSVKVKGTPTGTSTDPGGRYEIAVANPQTAVLEFSFLGYESREVGVSGTTLDVTLVETISDLDEVIVVGYGSVKKSDLTGSVARVRADDFASQSVTQISEVLAGTVAGFASNQGTSAAGGGSMEIRGPNSLTAGSTPMLVVDGAIYNGSINDINMADVETLDILKDASSAAIFGSRAASGVILITTKKGKKGRPVINLSAKGGITQSNNERRGLGPEAYVQFRSDYFRQAFPESDYNFYTHPDRLPTGMSLEQWLALSNAPLPDPEREWMSRLRFTSVEQENYLAGKTMDAYDYVFRQGIRQEYDGSISGGTDKASYFWSVGYLDNEGILVGDQYTGIRSRLNADFTITDWLSAGLNVQFSDRDESAVPASLIFLYELSPYGQMYEANGDLTHYPHGQYTENPLLDYKRTSVLNKTNSLYSNLYANIKLPFGFNFKVSFQPRYEATKNYRFTEIAPHLGGISGEIPVGSRQDISATGWMIDNLLTWDREIGVHHFNVTLLANAEENKGWLSQQGSRDFRPNQVLGYHGLQFGINPELDNLDTRSTGDALMARLNYTLFGKYLITTSIRRDGYSAFGNENPRAYFPSAAVAWVVSDEKFFKSDVINRLKLRLSWGANGNRDIGTYASLSQMGASVWYDGDGTRVGVNTTTLSNYGLRWEKTTSLNVGMDIGLLKDKIDLTLDLYDMTTTDLLMNRQIPKITGFSNITSNLGELENKGIELTVNSTNISKPAIKWKSNLVFSLNRNKINKLFGDYSTYTLLGEQKTGDVPDFSNGWFPGQAIDVVWDYDIKGVWQTSEAEAASQYNLKPGDFKVDDVDGDHRFVDLQDKKFIGYESPRYRIGLRNDVTFLQHFTASLFIRADLGHIGSFRDGMNAGYGIYDRVNRPSGPIPYWTPENGNTEYPGLTPNYEGFGGTLLLYKPKSFVRIQDVSLSYNLPSSLTQTMRMANAEVFSSVRNLMTFTDWPGWDPESGAAPMPRTFTLGFRCSL